jgi:hypothetical protein
MNWIIMMVMALLTMATGAQAKNQIYGVSGRSLAGEGYQLFVSDKILDTVVSKNTGSGAGNCTDVDENTSKNLGDISTIRSDDRFSIAANAKISYSTACLTYGSVVERLKTADDARRLWLLFGDSTTDAFAEETLKSRGTDKEINDELSLLIESKRLSIVSKYIEFFTKNKEWRLVDYTFLAQAFKSRKGKPLSPAYSQFIEALLTGDTEKSFQTVKSIDIENLGARFITPGTHDHNKKDTVEALIHEKR